MSNIKVSTSKMKSDADKIDEYVASLPNFIKELEASMTSLSECWEGPAWGGYQQTVAGYMEILNEVYKNMADYTAKMNESAKDYHRAEQDVCTAIDMVVVL